MLSKLLALKVNFVIVFAGALFIILLVKAISVLLPDKYYFNFSKLVGGGSEPFIVDPPSVTGRKLCEVMERHSIPLDTFGRPVACGETLEHRLSQDDIDGIYTIALSSDPAVREAFRETLRRVGIKPLTDAEVKQIASENPTVGQAFEAIFESYAQQIRAIATKGPAKAIEALYADLRPPSENVNDSSKTPISNKGVPEDVTLQIIQAHQNLKTELTGVSLAGKIPAIRKSWIDQAISRLDTEGGDISLSISRYYTDGMLTALRASMSLGFSSFGLATGKDSDRKLIFAEINSFSWKNYILSILLRLTPVFLFGLLVGAAAGRSELFSIALAGGLTAFLLSWPLILMWDRLVQSNWSDKRAVFFSFYSIYMVSFFLTARSAGLLGTWLREQNIARLAAQSVQDLKPVIRVTWREVAINIAGAAVFNAAVYLWNLYIPLSTMAIR